MSLRIEKATPEDVPAIISMLKEFGEYEKLSEFTTATEESYLDALFGETPCIEIVIAYFDNAAAGYALFFPCFSSFRGWRGLYLEDLFIKEDFRGYRIGKALLTHVARTAKERNCSYIEFEVLDWNEPAINFYKKHGAEKMDSGLKYRFRFGAFEQLAELRIKN